MSARDFQRSTVYAAEHQLQWFYDNVPHLNVNVLGVPLQLEPEARFGDLSGIQRYVDRVQAMPQIVAAFGSQGRVRVRERKGEGAAHYQLGTIAINTQASAWSTGRGWAMRELVIIHELAHHYAGCGGHGPEFTKTLIKLLELLMGPQVALAMRMINGEEGVK